MKKVLAFIVCFAFLISGCKSNEFKESSISAKEFNAKFTEARSKIQSEKISGFMNFSLTNNSSKVTTSAQVKLDVDIISDPIQLKSKVTATVAEGTHTSTYDVEAYIKDNTLYVKLPELYSKEWIKYPIPDQFTPKILENNEEIQNLDVKIYENDKQYLIKEDIKQEDINKLIAEKQAETPIPSFSLFKLKQINTESYFDKETFNINKVKVNVETEYIGNVKIEVEIDFTNQNEIKEITLPKEALEAKTIPTEGN